MAKLIVGLGNPGTSYVKTRHNIGFDIVEVLAARWGLRSPSKKQWGCLVSDGQIAGEKAILALPQSYMNRSGQPVASMMGYFKCKPQDIIVIHDELSLAFGAVRCKVGGGHGGHNGLRDIIKHIGKDFNRVRFGIGRPPANWDPAKFVLAKWRDAEQAELESYINHGSDAIESILRDGVDMAMNRFNVRPRNGSQESLTNE